MTGFHADPEIFDRLRDRLSSGGDALDATPAPATPDAGAATAAIVGLIAQFTSAAADIVEAVGSAADAVAQSKTAYLTTDDQQTSAFTQR